MSDKQYRIDDLKETLAEMLESHTSTNADPFRGDTDVWVEGWLSEIVEWAADWRSEIEELG